MRRTYPELRENHILPLLTDLKGLARYRETQKAFDFPSGSRIKFGYLDGDRDILQYQGLEFDMVFIDEATQFSFSQFQILSACVRGVNDFPKRIYLTCNPGGIGHDWVKRLFIDKQYRATEDARDYRFISARVYDNEALMRTGGHYVRMLENLPASLRRAWLMGEWDIAEGRFFDEFDTDTHVTEGFGIPPDWPCYRSIDYGLDMTVCLWIARDPAGRAYVFRELYESGLIISHAAERIARMSRERVRRTFAPPDLFFRRQETGKSAADIFAEAGLPLFKVLSAREPGWMMVKEYLTKRPQYGGKARLAVFKNCPNLIRTLPQLMTDEKNPDDCALDPHELTHAPDALRAFCVSRFAKNDEPAAGQGFDDTEGYGAQTERFLRFISR